MHTPFTVAQLSAIQKTIDTAARDGTLCLFARRVQSDSGDAMHVLSYIALLRAAKMVRSAATARRTLQLLLTTL